MRFEIREAAGLTAGEREALGRLSRAVYPPEADAAWPGGLIEWATATFFVVCPDESGEALALVGIHLRGGLADGNPVKIGGIGGVKTHPGVRRRGFATTAVGIAVEFLRRQGTDFALLVCRPDVVPFYGRLGWRTFAGDLIVMQRGEAQKFTFNVPMTLPVSGDAPTGGVVDLMGPPW